VDLRRKWPGIPQHPRVAVADDQIPLRRSTLLVAPVGVLLRSQVARAIALEVDGVDEDATGFTAANREELGNGRNFAEFACGNVGCDNTRRPLSEHLAGPAHVVSKRLLPEVVFSLQLAEDMAKESLVVTL